jgi:hypothetical protein
MSCIGEKCHGQLGTLIQSSKSILCPTRIFKFFWQLKDGGLRNAVSTVTLRTRRFLTARGISHSKYEKGKPPYEEVLNLQPGDWVRVRSEEDILASLDNCSQNKGLAWMPIMSRYCGKKLKVYKRVDKIVLESTGEIRKLKNTVLLEGAVCDGIYGCDRSCFHFWREIWLERVNGDS